ncbi:MAG: sugar-binding protein, partial [Bacteroidota bacterium]
MKLNVFFLASFSILFSFSIFAQDAHIEETSKQPEDTLIRPTYTTSRIEGLAPVIDGLLDDPAWSQVEWSGGFHQRQPDDSAPVTEDTRFKILYDNRYLYVAWQALDSDPSKVEARLGRRDDFPGDWVEINFDSFNDKRTAFSFTTSASGVRGDEFISNDGNN